MFKKILLIIYLIVFVILGVFLYKQNKISMEYNNNIIVGYTQGYTAPIGYYELYLSKENGLENKYLTYHLSRFNLGIGY